MKRNFEDLPPEVLSHVYGYLPPESARAAAQVSNVFASELHQRHRLFSRKISLEDAFAPTLGDAFSDFLFSRLIPFILLEGENPHRTLMDSNLYMVDSDLVIRYYHVGDQVQLAGTLVYSDNSVLSLDEDTVLSLEEITGYLDDQYRFHLSGNKITVDTSRKTISFELVSPNELKIRYTQRDLNIALTTRQDWNITKFKKLLIFYQDENNIEAVFYLNSDNKYARVTQEINNSYDLFLYALENDYLNPTTSK